MLTQAERRFDVVALRKAIEQADAQRLTGFYAEDAQLRIIDRNSQPSHPLILRGKSAIANYWREVCTRQMTHRITQVVADADHVALTEECEYRDGCRVYCVSMMALSDAQIKHQTNVQAWDETSRDHINKDSIGGAAPHP